MVCAASAFTAFAQTPAPTPASTSALQGKEYPACPGLADAFGPGGPMHEVLQSLTPAERQQLQAAHQKAAADPAVAAAREKAKEAMKEAHDAMNAAMLKADPNIGPILDKLEAAKAEAKQQFKGRHHGKGNTASPAAN